MEWQDNGLSDGRGDLFDEALGQSMRWWATETSDGRLLLRRSVVIRCCALVALVVGVPGMIYNALPLMSPYITDWTAGGFSDSACFVLQAAFFRPRKSRSASLGVRYPRAE